MASAPSADAQGPGTDLDPPEPPGPPGPGGPGSGGSGPGRRPLVIGGLVVVAVVAVVALLVSLLGGSPEPGGGTSPSGANQPSTGNTQSAGADSSAAVLHGWGQPTRVDEFDGARPPGWDIYDGAGHNGNGRRSPDAISVRNGVLTITGRPDGTTGGLAWMPGQKYGRWEARMRAPVSDPTYHALLLLWPDAENWPEGGEVDFAEMTDPSRQSTEFFLHYGEDNKQDTGEVAVDATQWHNWAVEWTPDHIIAYVDGREWWRSEDTDKFPPGKMHLTIQLDWFPEKGKAGPVKESTMQVDWVKQYAL